MVIYHREKQCKRDPRRKMNLRRISFVWSFFIHKLQIYYTLPLRLGEETVPLFPLPLSPAFFATSTLFNARTRVRHARARDNILYWGNLHKMICRRVG